MEYHAFQLAIVVYVVEFLSRKERVITEYGIKAVLLQYSKVVHEPLDTVLACVVDGWRIRHAFDMAHHFVSNRARDLFLLVCG